MEFGGKYFLLELYIRMYITGNSYGSIASISCSVRKSGIGGGSGWLCSAIGIPDLLIL